MCLIQCACKKANRSCGPGCSCKECQNVLFAVTNANENESVINVECDDVDSDNSSVVSDDSSFEDDEEFLSTDVNDIQNDAEERQCDDNTSLTDNYTETM